MESRYSNPTITLSNETSITQSCHMQESLLSNNELNVDRNLSDEDVSEGEDEDEDENEDEISDTKLRKKTQFVVH